MTKGALWLSRKQPMCLTSQCSALASWLMALLGKRIRAAQPCANWTYRRWFPTDSRWNVFWGGLSGKCFFWTFLSHAFYACQTFHSVECLSLAALLMIQFFADLRFVFCLNFSGVLTDINILHCTTSEGRSRCNACWELDRLALLEKEITPFLWISYLQTNSQMFMLIWFLL